MKEEPDWYIDEDGDKVWYLPSKGRDYLHREDGPAIEFQSGARAWRYCNMLHREDGPALILSDGSSYWYIRDKLHRLNGPAIETANGNRHWFIEGKELPKEVEKWLEEENINLQTMEGQVAFKLRWS